jgi:YcxB-like protein
MTVTYELAQRDFYEALLAHRNRSTLTKCFLWFITFMWVACAVITVLGIALRPDLQPQKNLLPLVLLGAFWMFIFWGSPWLAARNHFWKQPSAQGTRTMLLDAAGIHWQWNGGSADVGWRNFVRFQETKNHFLLYSSPAIANIVPKRALTLDQMGAFRQFVTEHLPPGAAPTPHGKKISRTWVFLVVVIIAVVLLIMAIRNIH